MIVIAKNALWFCVGSSEIDIMEQANLAKRHTNRGLLLHMLTAHALPWI